MAIVPMKHLRLIAVSEEQDALLDELQQVGCVQISTPEVSEGDPDWAGLLSRKSSTLGEVSAELASLQNALSALNKYAIMLFVVRRADCPRLTCSGGSERPPLSAERNGSSFNEPNQQPI